MRATVAMALAMLVISVAACGNGDVKATRITPKFLESPQKIKQVLKALKGDDREAFDEYSGSRVMTGQLGLPAIYRLDGKDPPTVGEAIYAVHAYRTIRAECDAKHKVLNDEFEKIDIGTQTARHNALVKQINALGEDCERRINAGRLD